MLSSSPRRVWLLARVSTQSKTQDASNARQLESLKAYADRMGWVVVGQGEERISGGKGEADRPELGRAMAAVRGLACDCLMVTKIDRLGRSMRHVMAVIDELEQMRCGLVVAEMGSVSFMDTLTPQGRLMLQVFVAMAEFFRTDYADRSLRAIRTRQAKGLPCGRRPSVLIPPHAIVWARTVRAAGCSWSWVAVHALRELGSSYAYSVAAWRRALGSGSSTRAGTLPEVGVDLGWETVAADADSGPEGAPCRK
jgi:DNA invertase Pin-like site-specific DNA recombinase